MNDLFGFIGVPLGWVMFGINYFINNYGVSLVLFILITKAAMFPFAIKQQKSTARMAGMSAKQKELQRKYGTDKQKLNEATMKLYEEEGYNPMGGCLPMVLQMVLLFGIVDVIYKPLRHILRIPSDVVVKATEALTKMNGGTPTGTPEISIIKHVQEGAGEISTIFSQAQVADITRFDMNFLGMNLGEIPQWGFNALIIIPILSGLTALISTLISMKIQKRNGQEMQGAMKYTMLFMPLFSVYIGFTMPAGAGIYWTLSNLLMIAQQMLVQKMWPPEKVSLMPDKNAAKNKEKAAKKRQKMEEYNKMLEAKGMAPKPIPKKIAEPKVIDREALQQEKEATNKRLAEARKRMAEKYGESFNEDNNSTDAK